MEFVTAYGIKRRVQTVNNQPTMTKQSLADNADVNKIIKRYNKTGILQKAVDFEGVYGEFDTMDMQDAMNKVAQAQELFLEVPSEIRARFGNDPGQFIDWVTNADNREEAARLGLAKPMPPAQVPDQVQEPVSDPVSDPVPE